MLPHTPDRRSIIQHRFDLPQRCFRPFHNVLVTEIRQRFRFLFPHRLRKRQYRIRRNLPIADQIMNAYPFPRPFGKIPFQMLLVRTVKRHLFTPATERHIERFPVQRLRRYHYVFRSPPLRLVGRRHPAVIERSIVFWKRNAPANLSACIKKINITRLPGNPRKSSVVDFLLLEIHTKLDQITRAKFNAAFFSDINEFISRFQIQTTSTA